MNTSDPRQAGREEGERRKDAAHALLEARREVYLWRARRALLTKLLSAGTATADDVVEMIGSVIEGIDPRWRGAVPGPLARARIVRDSGLSAKSSRPEAHGRRVTVWELADRSAALRWLIRHRNPPHSDDGDGDAGTL
jgi:hypothetical protein